MLFIMDAAAKPAPDFKDLILETIAKRNYRPVDLLEELRSKGSESQLRSALTALVEAHVVELTSDRYIRLRTQSPIR
jgi:hypothetical protein